MRWTHGLRHGRGRKAGVVQSHGLKCPWKLLNNLRQILAILSCVPLQVAGSGRSHVLSWCSQSALSNKQKRVSGLSIYLSAADCTVADYWMRQKDTPHAPHTHTHTNLAWSKSPPAGQPERIKPSWEVSILTLACIGAPFGSKDFIINKYVHICHVVWIRKQHLVWNYKMLLVLRNETQANSLTRSLFLVDFEAVSASLLACDVIIAKKMGRQIKRPLRSNLKRKTTRWPGGGEARGGGWGREEFYI